MNVFDYLISLPQKVIQELFEDPWTCQAIFRALPPLAKQYILRLLFLDSNVSLPLSFISTWVKTDKQSQHSAAIERLTVLGICSVQEYQNTGFTQSRFQGKTSAPEKMVQLNPVFQQKLKISLCESEHTTPWHADGNNGSNLKPDKRKPSLETLDSYSQKCWEALLRFMIGNPTTTPSTSISSLIQRIGLMKMEESGKLHVTKEGFQFLLKDTYSQLWTLLIAYIDSLENKKEVLSFLFQLSFLILGKGYPIQGFASQLPQQVLQDLCEFGLIYQRKNTSRRFYPTRLAISLSSSQTEKSTTNDASGSGYIIIEQNFRLYAYTNSSLQIAILSLFVKIKYQLPNLVMGVVNRESVRNAFVNGITADQILWYLKKNAHPEMLKNNPVVPENVTDQVRLWELERKRVSFAKGVLYDSFPSEQAFLQVVNYSKDSGVFLWADVKNQKLLVTEQGHELVRPYIKKYIS